MVEEIREEEGVRARLEVEPVEGGWTENDGSMSEEAMYAIRELEIEVQRMVGEL